MMNTWLEGRRNELCIFKKEYLKKISLTFGNLVINPWKFKIYLIISHNFPNKILPDLNCWSVCSSAGHSQRWRSKHRWPNQPETQSCSWRWGKECSKEPTWADDKIHHRYSERSKRSLLFLKKTQAFMFFLSAALRSNAADYVLRRFILFFYFFHLFFFYSPFVLRNYSTDSHKIFRNCVF